ncbi:MAG: ABC transporter ATP-binding protein [Candidatus Thermoplasmatota archaeon]|nr:ABC transporter ATP-binding protein [Candidatus Thermoplasmatota archaeon]
MPALRVENLVMHYETRRGPVRAVDNITFDLERGHTLAIVGESGCGKTSTAIAILRLLPKNISRYEGTILFEGEDIMQFDDRAFRKQIRWRGISMVFQGAMNSLNPTARVGQQLAEPLRLHLKAEPEEAKNEVAEALESVGLPPDVARRYPHELSGGMKQRVVIAMALILKPQLVILDEPTSALDVMTQANIMNLLKRLKKAESISYLFITHDFSLASELADEVGVMYAGQLAEIGPSEELYAAAQHPYSQGLLRSVPRLRSTKRPTHIPGVPPDLVEPPIGCRFHPRCPVAFERCGWEAEDILLALRHAIDETDLTGGLPPLEGMEVEDAQTLRLLLADGTDPKGWLDFVRNYEPPEGGLRGFLGIRDVKAADGSLVLRTHEGEHPSIIGQEHRAACHLLVQAADGSLVLRTQQREVG